MPKISVIIPTYNCAKYLAKAIDSVINQTYQNFEIIVIDDGSTDNTKVIIEEYARKYPDRIRFFIQNNRGPAGARNTGIRASHGEYIAFLDSDDTWLPKKLAESIRFLQDNNFDWICTSMTRIKDGEAESIKRIPHDSWVFSAQDREIHQLRHGLFFFSDLYLKTPTVFAKRECFEKAGIFDESFLIGEDWDLWLRFEEAGLKGGYLDKPLTVYKSHNKSITKNARIDGLRDHVRVAQKHAKLLGINNPLIRRSYADFLWITAICYYTKRKFINAAKYAILSFLYSPGISKLFKIMYYTLRKNKRKVVSKTLLFTTQYPPHVGGVPNFYYHLSRLFPKGEITIFTAMKDVAEYFDKIVDFPVYRTRFLNDYRVEYRIPSLLKNIPVFFRLIWIIFKEKIDKIIIGQSDIPLLFMCYTERFFLKMDYIVFLHGDGDSSSVRLKSDNLKKYLYNKAKCFIVNSAFTKKRLQEKYNIDDKKIYVIYPGVDTKMFCSMDRIMAKNELKLTDKRVLLTVGRLDKRKGHDMVLKALPEIMKEIPDIIYLIVGTGRYKPELDRLVKEIGIEGNVRFVGNVPNEGLAKFYNACDLFIMPNRELDDGDTEGFGMVFIEANACGRPVIGGRCGGAVEAIKENETGLLVDPYDIDDIAKKVVYLLKNDEALKQMGEAGRLRALNEFGWEDSVKTNIDKFKEIFLS